MNALKKILKYTGLSLLLLVVLLVSGYLAMRLVVHGEEVVTVPNLIGADVVKALGAAAEKNLDVRVEGFEYSSQVAKNHVIFQDPPPGSSIKRGRDLRLVISRGPEALLGPQLVGLPVGQAVFILEQNDLVPGKVVRVHSAEGRPDIVLAQDPPPHASMHQRQGMDMLVSAGPRPEELVVPDVTGRSAVEAAFALEAVGLKQGQLSMACRPEHADGEVLDQRPRAGFKASRGAAVALVINQSQPSATASDFTIFSYRVPDGLRRQQIKIDLVGSSGTRELHYGVHDGGEIVQVSFPKGEEATVIVYQNGAEVLRKRY